LQVLLLVDFPLPIKRTCADFLGIARFINCQAAILYFVSALDWMEFGSSRAKIVFVTGNKTFARCSNFKFHRTVPTTFRNHRRTNYRSRRNNMRSTPRMTALPDVVDNNEGGQ